MTDEKDDDVINMKIDEIKEYTPYHVSQSRIMYSDHCAIIVRMNVMTINNEQDIQI